jgi:hypothetical protein
VDGDLLEFSNVVAEQDVGDFVCAMSLLVRPGSLRGL